MNKKKNPRNRLNRYSVYIAGLSLLVSLASFGLSFYVWHDDRKPSISATCDAQQFVEGSYEPYIYNSIEFGRYLIAVSISVSNNSKQGCILHCMPLFKPSKNGEFVSFPNPTELIFKDNNNPLESLPLESNSSCSVDFELYIYFPSEIHQKLCEKFGEDISSTRIQKLLYYLYSEGISPQETAPIMGFTYEPKFYRHVPAQDGKLILYISTNTGASDSVGVDYLLRDFFKLEDRLSRQYWYF